MEILFFLLLPVFYISLKILFHLHIFVFIYFSVICDEKQKTKLSKKKTKQQNTIC